MPKHKEKETNTKDQTVTVKCSKEQSNIEVKVDEPLEFCTLPKIINDLIDNTMKEGTMLETSTSCTSIVQQINVLEDHNQTKSMDAPHQAYLVESAT